MGKAPAGTTTDRRIIRATPIEQIKLYQGGVGTDEAVIGGLVTVEPRDEPLRPLRGNSY